MDPSAKQYTLPEAFRVGLGDGPMAIWASVDSDIGQRFAAAEATGFPEALDLFASSPEYLMLGISLDGYVMHMMRLSVPMLNGAVEMPFLLRDLAESGQNLSEADLKEYYQSIGIDLHRTLSVETNIRLVGGDVIDLRSADIAYLAVFDLVRRIESMAVFCHLNGPACKSFERVGIPFEAICGRSDLRTPAADVGEFDDAYAPYCIERRTAGPVFEALVSLVPEHHWSTEQPAWWDGDEEVIDLREPKPATVLDDVERTGGQR